MNVSLLAPLSPLDAPVVAPVAEDASSHQPRLGERQSQAWIHYGRPDVTGAQSRHYKRARIAVIGDGETVEHLLDDLDALARQKPGTTVTHVTPQRCSAHASPATPKSGRVEGFRVHGFYPTEGGVMLEGDDGRWIGPFDRLIVDDGVQSVRPAGLAHTG